MAKDTTRRVKGAYHLEIRTATVVPSTKNISQKISEQEFKNRVMETKRFLSELFGGYTTWKAIGGYTIRDKTVEEKVGIVIAYATKKDFIKHKKTWIRWVKQKKRDWGQDSIGIEIEDDLIYV